MWNKKILLASHSPRRHELLRLIAPDFGTLPIVEVDETYPASLPAEEVPAYLSKLKAEAYHGHIEPDTLVITADTVVIIDGKILGKPADRAEAVEMLATLAGRTHRVVTGVTITDARGEYHTFSDTSEVDFDTLTREEIEFYVDNFSPYDKAGAYGIQEWIGAAGIKGIRGSFYNVMGLPVHRLYLALRELDK